MRASSYYYDEVTGGLSTAPIVLRALYDVTTGGAQTAHVIVTHLAHARALGLMSAGTMTLEAAEAQAEGELETALGIRGTGFAPPIHGIALDELGANDTANAYLFVVSAVLVQTAIEQAGEAGSVDGTLQELLDTVASDVATGCSYSPTDVVGQAFLMNVLR